MIQQRDIHDVARYIGLSLITKGMSVSPLKLQKLLYYAQAWFMVFYGRQETLFGEAPQAWVNGPVYPDIFREYKVKTAGMCDHLRAEDFCQGSALDGLHLCRELLALDDDRIETLESIITLYGAKSQNQLILLTHSEQPWAEARQGLAPYERSEREISLDTMFRYYQARHQRNLEKASQA